MPTYFIVRRGRGPAWNTAVPMRAQALWAEHAAFMNALAADGFVVLGGPVGTGEEEFLFVIDSPSEDAIRARLAADPWSELRLLEIRRVEPWTLLLDSRRAP
jgi:uncharacterized protein YciI